MTDGHDVPEKTFITGENKMNMKRSLKLAAIFAGAVVTITGCASMIIDAHKKIEPCKFQILPPDNRTLCMLQPDERSRADIVGRWICQSTSESYSKVDLNGKPFMHTNGGTGHSTQTINFSSDGKLDFRIETTQQDLRSGKKNTTVLEQSGSWKCQNGIFNLTLFNKKLNKEFTVAAEARWHGPDSMELRYDTEAFGQMVRETMFDSCNQLDAYTIYFDKEGFLYNIIILSSANSKMSTRTEFIMKQTPPIYKRQK